MGWYGSKIIRRVRETWVFILSERETLDTLVVFLLTAVLGVAAVSWAETQQPATPLFTVFGIAVSREVSLGTFGSAVLIIWQVGRWGRRMVDRFTHLPEKIEKLEFRIERLGDSVSAIDSRCPLRNHADERGCE